MSHCILGVYVRTLVMMEWRQSLNSLLVMMSGLDLLLFLFLFFAQGN